MQHKVPKNKLTPTQLIQRSPALRERVWTKRPRKRLVKTSITLSETGESVESINNDRKAKLTLHTHPTARRQRQELLPSFEDFYFGKIDKWQGIRTQVIAVKDRKKVAGYVFFKIPANFRPHELKRYGGALNANQEVYEKVFKQTIDLLKKRGLRIKFVPNKKQGYEFRNGEFLRK